MVLVLYVLGVQATIIGVDNVRETIRLDKGWKFAMGHASDPLKDFGCGTEYFNYLTKANSIHNEGPYSQKFNDSQWQEVQIPHDWVPILPYAKEASTECGMKNMPDSTWWTRVLKPIMDQYPLSYFLLWRNYKEEYFGRCGQGRNRQ